MERTTRRTRLVIAPMTSWTCSPWACRRVGVHYTRPRATAISIACRPDVARLDTFMGFRPPTSLMNRPISIIVAFELALALAGCATTTTPPPPATTPAPALSTGGDAERCQASGGVWRNGMCTTMGGGGY